MITAAQADDIRAREAAHQAWLGKRTSYHPSELPADAVPPTNEERSALEVYEFTQSRPDRYFVYVKRPADMLNVPRWRTCEKGKATTWTGDELGTITFGYVYRDNFGGTRVPVTVHAITGDTYYGTYYASSGDYARLRKAKRKVSA